ncbi:MAG TPA: aldehyde dehydrogenase family protein, partial [Armatimonadota bacterium]|nr:aldehyde dehydrogenase family protein [Armatimonadota bacterium]
MNDQKPFLIGGGWRKSDDIREVRFPYNNDIVASVCQATDEDLEDAVVSASSGFEITRKLAVYQRSKILNNL